jgi:hypothetical protein
VRLEEMDKVSAHFHVLCATVTHAWAQTLDGFLQRITASQ